MTSAQIAFIFLGVLAGVGFSSGDPLYQTIDKLHKKLLENYNNQVLPYVNVDEPVVVNVGITPIHFDLDEDTSRFIVTSFFQMIWKDERLKWSPEEYGGIQDIRMSSDLVWKPDLALYNGAEANGVALPTGLVLILHNGMVFYIPPMTFDVPCKLNMMFWPFDGQRCVLKIGPWTHHNGLISFNSTVNETQKVDLTDLSPHGYWRLLDAVSILNINYYPCCKEAYPVMKYTFTILREDAVLQHVLKIPAILVILITLTTFLLPANSGKKLTASLVNLVIISIFITYFVLVIPSVNHIPIIVTIYGSIFILVGVSVIANILITTISQLNRSRAPPKFIQRILNNRCVNRILFMDTKRNKRCSDDETGEENAFQWFILATALDRIIFIIYMNVVSSLIFSLFSHTSKVH